MKGNFKMNILIIEDNRDIYDGLKYSLEENNYSVLIATTIRQAKEILTKVYPDLIILDITLPDGNGFNLYEKYIKETKIPTLILTALDTEENIVKGLELGADDYLTKPFGVKELLTRIKKILIRNHKESIIKIQDLTFDIDNMKVLKNNKELELTALELKILNMLIINKGNIVKRECLIDKV